MSQEDDESIYSSSESIDEIKNEKNQNVEQKAPNVAQSIIENFQFQNISSVVGPSKRANKPIIKKAGFNGIRNLTPLGYNALVGNKVQPIPKIGIFFNIDRNLY